MCVSGGELADSSEQSRSNGRELLALIEASWWLGRCRFGALVKSFSFFWDIRLAVVASNKPEIYINATCIGIHDRPTLLRVFHIKIIAGQAKPSNPFGFPQPAHIRAWPIFFCPGLKRPYLDSVPSMRASNHAEV